MKKVIGILAVAAVMTACGSKSTEAEAEVVVDSTEVSVDSTMVEPTEMEAESTVVVE